MLEGLQSDVSVADLCRKHEISATLYYRWRDRLFERADRLFGRQDGTRERELERLRAEATHLKEVVAELTAENLKLKKAPGASRTRLPFPESSGR